jgi:hypothetical protein
MEYLDYRNGLYNLVKRTDISGQLHRRELTGIIPMIKIE